MLRLNVADMSDLELTEHIKALTEERDMRERRDRENAWNDFRNELMNYIEKYGPIEICDSTLPSFIPFTLDIDHIVDSSEIGKIIVSD